MGVTVKVVVYSAIYGNYEPPRWLPDLGIPAIMYTDEPDLEVPGWTTAYDPLPHIETPMLRAKYWKCHPLAAAPDADVSLWLDASMTVLAHDYVERCLAALGDDSWCAVKHPSRDCIYTEAETSMTMPRYGGTRIGEQVAAYRKYGHPPNWGLFANGANVRRHTPIVEAIGVQWWHECTFWSYQDQLSLPVLFRLAGSALRWNANMPWGLWWTAGLHSPAG